MLPVAVLSAANDEPDADNDASRANAELAGNANRRVTRAATRTAITFADPT
jgi:hypothetical protein